jgi:hypothetical protein
VLLKELVDPMENEKHSADNQVRATQNKDQVLYNAFVQDAIEFMMLLMVPTEKKITIDSYHELIAKEKFTLPDWMEPLIRVSYFLHFFRGQMRLPVAILTEIHD